MLYLGAHPHKLDRKLLVVRLGAKSSCFLVLGYGPGSRVHSLMVHQLLATLLALNDLGETLLRGRELVLLCLDLPYVVVTWLHVNGLLCCLHYHRFVFLGFVGLRLHVVVRGTGVLLLLRGVEVRGERAFGVDLVSYFLLLVEVLHRGLFYYFGVARGNGVLPPYMFWDVHISET